MTVEEARRLLQTDDVAQHLLSSPIMARLAYTWRDGARESYPCGSTGRGDAHGCATKLAQDEGAGRAPAGSGQHDTVEWPYQWLTVRGTASVQVSSEPFVEYLTMVRRYLGDAGGEQFLTALRQTFQG